MNTLALKSIAEAVDRHTASQLEIAGAIRLLAEKVPLMTRSLIKVETDPAKPPRPEFVRMPTNNRLCPYTGLSRSFLYGLATEGKIRTISLRRRGTMRGVRLIDLDSLLTYIRCMETVKKQITRSE